ncbi:MAG: peptidylprolyl isomerase [Thalassotalea sp.]|nr:peptidylprolyl isomerase [Thalassotalea sp.]
MKHSSRLCGLVASTLLIPTIANATVVEFVTSQGNVRVNLHDETTPKTVDNFLNYVSDGDYNESLIHRVETNFVIQGGGFKYQDDGFNFGFIDTDDAVVNEPVWSNVKGTIAMAKLSGNANSATSQWFFNMTDNSANLDVQNGGFTVFGQVVEEDMPVLEAINELTRCSNSFGATPMVNYTGTQCTSGEAPGYENFVTIYSVDIIDETVVTDSALSKTPNTLIDEDNTSQPDTGSGGGGSLFWLLLCSFFGLSRFKR